MPIFIIGLCDFQDDYNDAAEAKRNLDELTRLLCEADKVYRGEKLPSIELLQWWGEHRKKDEYKFHGQ
jgi:hypothetical protein